MKPGKIGYSQYVKQIIGIYLRRCKINDLPHDLRELLLEVDLNKVVNVNYNGYQLQIMKDMNNGVIDVWYSNGDLLEEINKIGIGGEISD